MILPSPWLPKGDRLWSGMWRWGGAIEHHLFIICFSTAHTFQCWTVSGHHLLFGWQRLCPRWHLTRLILYPWENAEILSCIWVHLKVRPLQWCSGSGFSKRRARSWGVYRVQCRGDEINCVFCSHVHFCFTEKVREIQEKLEAFIEALHKEK